MPFSNKKKRRFLGINNIVGSFTPLRTPLHVPPMGRTLAVLPTLQVLRLLFLSLSAVWDHTKYHITTTIHKQLTSFYAIPADHKFTEIF